MIRAFFALFLGAAYKNLHIDIPGIIPAADFFDFLTIFAIFDDFFRFLTIFAIFFKFCLFGHTVTVARKFLTNME